MITLLVALVSWAGFAGLTAYARADRFAGPDVAGHTTDVGPPVLPVPRTRRLEDRR